MPERHAPARATAAVLAFDFGLQRIGVAVGSTGLRCAQPLATISAAATAPRFLAIEKLIDEWRPQQLVVGLPLSVTGEAHMMSARCRKFAQQLAGRFRLPVALTDERYTSLEAETQLKAAGRRHLRQHVDAAAAAVILQSWFDTHVGA